MKAEKRLQIKRHENREDLAGEHPFGDMGQMLLFLLFLAVWAADSFFLKYSIFLTRYVPLTVRLPMAAAILIVSGYFAKSGLNIVFGETRAQPVVIRKGVFNLVRHPIYFGAILFYLGLFVGSLSMMALVIWLVIVAFYYFITRYEEEILIQQFGEDYKHYMAQVPMLFPRIRK